jgi:hypothetical protein
MKVFKDFRVAPDGDILDQIQELLSPNEPGLGNYLPAVSFFQAELTRRAVARLLESSTRLERLTKVLIFATAVLLVFAVPPALDIISRFCSR